MEHHERVQTYLEKKDNGWNDIDIYEGFHDGSRDNPGLFFWIQDEAEAVFLLSRTGATARGLAFRTRDAKLIEIFKATFEEKKAKSEARSKGIRRRAMKAH